MSADLFEPVLRREAPDVTPTNEDPLGQRKPALDDVLWSLRMLRREVHDARNVDAEKFNASQERVAALERRVETLERLVRLLERMTLPAPVAPVPVPYLGPIGPWPGRDPIIITCGPALTGTAAAVPSPYIDGTVGPFAGVVRDLQNVTAGQEHA